MPEQYVALLRGINVGRAKRVTMSELREAVSSLGHSDVRTLLNSGNVVFTAEKTPTAKELQKAVVDRTAVKADVVLLTGSQLAQVMKENPLADVATDPSRLQVMFFAEDSDRRLVRKLVGDPWDPEQLAVGHHAAFLWCPNGITSSPLMEAVGAQQFRSTTTTRNWRTVSKLLTLLG